MLKLLLVLFAPVVMLITVSYSVRYLLKRKLMPNEQYLKEIKELGRSKRLRYIGLVIILIFILMPSFNGDLTLAIILLVITEGVYNKCALDYLNTKSENTDTRRYVLYEVGFQTIIVIVTIGYYIIFKSTGYFLFQGILKF